MNQKNIWWWVGGAILVVIMLIAVGLFVSQSITPPVSNTNPSIVVTKQSMQKDDGVSKIDIEYPSISGVPQAINDKIQEILNNRIAEFKKTVTENEQARIDTNKQLSANEQRPAQPSPGESWYMLNITYFQGSITAQKVSVVFFVDEYSGGAHGNKSFIPFNYDIVQNKEIKLADVFSNTPQYLQHISEYAYTDILKQLNANASDVAIDTEWVKTGTEPKEDNFSNFTLGDDNSITFYIPQYQVAAYVYGDFQVTMPLNVN